MQETIPSSEVAVKIAPGWGAGVKADAELLRGVLRYDRQAQEEFVKRYSRLVRTILRKSGVAREEQEDLYVQIFLHLWEDDCHRLRKWQPQGRLSSFIGMVVQHLVTDYQRSQSRHRPCHLDDYADTSDETAEPFHQGVFVRLQKEAVDATLQEMLPRDAKLVFRRYYLGESYQQIAQGLGMTVNLVGVCLARARERLRQRLVERYPGLFVEYGDSKPS